jgi:hypothetical protein
MKKTLLFIALLSLSLCGMAQKKSVFPFKGGVEHMMNFFKDSVIVSQDVIQRKATGAVMFKFTADALGRVSKIVLYYADDAVLAQPAADALKRSSGKWDIPVGVNNNDYLITFSFSFVPPAAAGVDLVNAVYDYTVNHKPITFSNQLLTDDAILLPTVLVSYDIPQ